MRRLAARCLAIVGLACLAACSTSAQADGPPPIPASGSASIAADRSTFDRERLDVPADTAFQLLFENREGVLHNVAIVDPANGTTPFVGEIFGGPGWRMYQVPALPGGTYAFRCDVHLEMSGTLVAD
jgi:hypothetical protein